MLIVAGLSLKNLRPRVWDADSPYWLPDLQAVMVSYAEFAQAAAARRAAMTVGVREYLGVPAHVRILLDNGSFYFLNRAGDTTCDAYLEFVAEARPDWWPVPRDVIPSPCMSPAEQRGCFERTMAINRLYAADACVPVIHISSLLDEYITFVTGMPSLAAKPSIALGGIVPNLLRTSKARPYAELLDGVRHARLAFVDKHLHVFGVGGTATLHLAALLGVNSVDSSGWRNRAARGLVQLPGSGDRTVADLGKWRGRQPSEDEWKRLGECACPACQRDGLAGLKAHGVSGFATRATHNLWTLLEEARLIESHLAASDYPAWFDGHLDNSIYRPLIEYLLRVPEPATPR